MQGTTYIWKNTLSLMGLIGDQTGSRQAGVKKKANMGKSKCSMNMYLLIMFLMCNGNVCPSLGPVKCPCAVAI